MRPLSQAFINFITISHDDKMKIKLLEIHTSKAGHFWLKQTCLCKLTLVLVTLPFASVNARKNEQYSI